MKTVLTLLALGALPLWLAWSGWPSLAILLVWAGAAMTAFVALLAMATGQVQAGPGERGSRSTTTVHPAIRMLPFIAVAALFVPMHPLIGLAFSHSLERATADLERVATAITRFETEHGDYPNDLEDLVPDQLESVPAMPGSGYSPILYGVTSRTRYGYDSPDGDWVLRSWVNGGPFGTDQIIRRESRSYSDLHKEGVVRLMGLAAYASD